MKMIEEAKVSDEKSRNFAENIIRFSKTVLEIPDNTTNGDMFCNIFEVIEVNDIGDDSDDIEVVILMNGERYLYTFPKSWWNSPYKRGTE